MFEITVSVFGLPRLRAINSPKNARKMPILFPTWQFLAILAGFPKISTFFKKPSLEMKFVINFVLCNQNIEKNHQSSTGPCL